MLLAFTLQTGGTSGCGVAVGGGDGKGVGEGVKVGGGLGGAESRMGVGVMAGLIGEVADCKGVRVFEGDATGADEGNGVGVNEGFSELKDKEGAGLETIQYRTAVKVSNAMSIMA